MIPGFNHNIQYKGQTYHIQTEDSGLANPHIITLLYRGGNIIAKKKTSYGELTQKSDQLPQVVRELMEQQHKAMLRELIRGGFEQPAAAAPIAMPKAAPPPPTPPPPPIPEQAATQEIKISEVEGLFGGSEKPERSLDEIILSFLADEKT